MTVSPFLFLFVSERISVVLELSALLVVLVSC